jgi:hypothetical protein
MNELRKSIASRLKMWIMLIQNKINNNAMCRITISVLFMAVSFIGRSNQIYKEEITNLAEITESTNFISKIVTMKEKPPFLKNYFFFQASKIKFGLVDFHDLLARWACGLKSFP